MNLLLISNSTNPGEAYLDYPKLEIQKFLGTRKIKALFLPYAAVTFSFGEYEEKVRERFNEIGHDIESIHKFSDPIKAVDEARAIIVGGGNTWQLLRMIRENNLIEPIRKKILSGIPYIGWSAGSNVACPTIRTTNDMPIIDPKGFDAFNLVPFQINPHYLDKNPEGFGGETREARIMEFIEINPGIYVTGLREGCMFKIIDHHIEYIGKHPCRIFIKGKEPVELFSGNNFDFLLK